ncbi:MAG: CdaR family protein [Acidobacteriota bacterium]
MWLAKNLGWKVGSLTLAILLWLAFSSAPAVVTNHTAPIVYRNLPAGWMISGNAPETVHLELRGPAGRLTVSSLAETVVLLDLADIGNTEDRTFTISETNLNLPPGVAFLRAVPSQLRLHLARLAEKQVPVEIRFSGSLPVGYQLTGKTVVPDRLSIAGPETLVTAVTKVQTDPIDLHSLTQSGDFRVDTFVDDSQVRLDSPPEVTVHLTIERTGK